jgi:hypothetical protein
LKAPFHPDAFAGLLAVLLIDRDHEIPALGSDVRAAFDRLCVGVKTENTAVMCAALLELDRLFVGAAPDGSTESDRWRVVDPMRYIARTAETVQAGLEHERAVLVAMGEAFFKIVTGQE